MTDWGELIGWGVLTVMVMFASRRYDKKLKKQTVEQEQAKSREIASHAPQWNPGVTVTPETHDYSGPFDLDDCTPESVSTFIRERGKAS